MDYKTDINEVVKFINAYGFNKVNNDYTSCLKRLTESIDEKYLSERADAFSNAVIHNNCFKNAIKSLASFCYDTPSNCTKCPVKKYCNHYISKARANIGKDSLKMVDMFCGSGGLSLGFTQEGFVTSLANDIMECCVDTYAHNHPETPRNRIILGDIKQVVNDIEDLLNGENVDIVVGGPPCQGFSEANRQRVIDDPRNHLYKSFVEVVKKVNPPFFVMENVKGMLSVADQVIDDFKSIGYNVVAKILNAKDFGVPQNRERLIYIGNRIGIDNNLVFKEIEDYRKTIKPAVLSDALFNLRELQASKNRNATDVDTELSGFWIEHQRTDSKNEYIRFINQNSDYPLVLNHKARYNNDRDIEIFRRMLPGDKSDDPKIADIMPYANRNGIFRDKYFKLEPNKVCKTITAHMKFDCNMYIHPSQARGLTPREAARVQSYPDDYYFRGSFTKVYMQIGNSVPPLLGRAIAKAVKKFITSYKALLGSQL